MNGALFLSLIGKHLEHHNHQHHEARQKPDDSVGRKNISFLEGDELTFANFLWVFVVFVLCMGLVLRSIGDLSPLSCVLFCFIRACSKSNGDKIEPSLYFQMINLPKRFGVAAATTCAFFINKNDGWMKGMSSKITSCISDIYKLQKSCDVV